MELQCDSVFLLLENDVVMIWVGQLWKNGHVCRCCTCALELFPSFWLGQKDEEIDMRIQSGVARPSCL